MTVVFIIIAILTLILIAWMWTSLGNIEKTTKLKCIIIGIVVVYIITFVIYSISTLKIKYENKEIMIVIRRVFVILFTIINSCLILPYTFRKLEQINNEEIEQDMFKKTIIILLVIILILAIFETNYLSNVQQRILDLINK